MKLDLHISHYLNFSIICTFLQHRIQFYLIEIIAKTMIKSRIEDALIINRF